MAGDTFDVEPGARVAQALQTDIVAQLASTDTTTDNDVLVYKAVDGKWHPEPASSAGTVTSVTASSPLASTGGTAPDISLGTPVPTSKGGFGGDVSTGLTDGDVAIVSGGAITVGTLMISGERVTTDQVQAGMTLVSNGQAWIPSYLGRTDYYLNNTASSIPTYFQLTPQAASGGEVTVSQTASSGAVLLAVFATNAGDPGITSIPAGLWDMNFYAAVSGGSTCNLRADWYSRTSGGVETLLFSSDGPTLSGSTVAEYDWTASESTFTLSATTDRLVLKVYAVNSAPTSRTVTLYYQGALHASHIHTPLSAANAATDLMTLSTQQTATGQKTFSQGLIAPSIGTDAANLHALGSGTGTLLDANSSLPAANLTGTIAIARIPTGTSSSTVTIGNDTRLNPAPSGAGKMAYDNGSAYVALTAGTSATVLHGGSAPSFSAIAATDISSALAASTYSASSTFSAANQATLTGNNGFCVAVQGKYAYVTDLSGSVLSVVDVSNPAAPSAVGAVTLAGQLRALAVQGNYAYVCNNSGNLFYVVDISNPSAPSQVGSVAITSPYGMCVSGKYAYVFSENGTSSTIKVVDLSTPAAPAVVGSAAADNTTCAKLDVKGKYLYTAASVAQTISIYDISVPTAPVRLNTPLNVAIAVLSVEASGRYVYATDTTSKLVVVDVSNPASPSLVTTLTLTHTTGGIWLAGRYAFVLDSSFTVIRIVDIQVPGSPTQIVTISTGASVSGIGVSVVGKYAYLAYSSNPDKLGVIDLGGIETSVVKAASMQAGRLLVTESLNVAGSVSINSGLAVGPNGLYCDGPMTAKALNLGDGAVTQGSSVTTAVTLNTSSGVITTFSQSAAAGATSTFTVTNSFCLSTSTVLLSIGSYAGTYGTNGFPLATVSAVANGSFNVTIVNMAPSNALSGALKLNFAIL